MLKPQEPEMKPNCPVRKHTTEETVWNRRAGHGNLANCVLTAVQNQVPRFSISLSGAKGVRLMQSNFYPLSQSQE